MPRPTKTAIPALVATEEPFGQIVRFYVRPLLSLLSLLSLLPLLPLLPLLAEESL